MNRIKFFLIISLFQSFFAFSASHQEQDQAWLKQSVEVVKEGWQTFSKTFNTFENKAVLASVGIGLGGAYCLLKLYQKINDYTQKRALQKLNNQDLLNHITQLYNKEYDFFKTEIELINALQSLPEENSQNHTLESKKEISVLLQVLLRSIETITPSSLPLINHVLKIEKTLKELTLYKTVINKREMFLLYPRDHNYEVLSKEISDLLQEYSNLQIKIQLLLEKLTFLKDLIKSLKEYKVECLLTKTPCTLDPFSALEQKTRQKKIPVFLKTTTIGWKKKYYPFVKQDLFNFKKLEIL